MIVPSNQNVCGVIVTYNPTSKLKRLITILNKFLNTIIIIDNSPLSFNLGTILGELLNDKVELICNGKNLGIAKGINQGIERAMFLNYKWVITFDQDSEPFPEMFSLMKETYLLFANKDKIGAIGVNMIYKDSTKYFKVSSNNRYAIKDYLITSGCMMPIDIFNKVGKFREDFFIDNVDIEYSLRLRRFGYVNLITNLPGMYHEPGDSIKAEIACMKIHSSNHTSKRRYYMARNHVILTREYFLYFPYFILKLNYFYIRSLIQLLIVESDKKLKFKFIWMGIKEGIKFKKSI